MTPVAAYDEIADWYEHSFLSDGDPIGVKAALDRLLGNGNGVCLEVGCGTGVHAAQVRGLGWTPVGVDLSAGMLRHATARLPVARGDAHRMPVHDGSIDAAIAVMVHTDLPGTPTGPVSRGPIRASATRSARCTARCPSC